MKRGFIIALAAVATLGVSGAVAQQKTIAIGTGGTGGVYYPIGGALANLLSKNLKNTQATAQVTGGSVDNLKLIGSGQSEIGFSMADAAVDALKGEDKFKGNPVNLRTLMVLYPNIMHVVSIEGTGVNTMADLKGKRVSTGAPGSATEVMAFRVIEASGLDKDKDMKRERLSVAESVNAIKDRKIDAFFWVGGLPTAGVTDLAATPGVKIKMIDHTEVVAKMNAKYNNLYAPAVIKAGTYPGQTADNKVSAVWNILVTNDKMTDQEAYDIVKLMVEKKADLVAVHKDAESFSVDNQIKSNSPVPWNAGAVKYFVEKGATLEFSSMRVMMRRPRFGGAVCFCGQRETDEIGQRTEQRDAEAHRPIGVIGHRDAKPGFGQRQQRRNNEPAPQSGGDALRRGGRSHHQREDEQHADDLRAGRNRDRDDGEERGRDEPHRHTFGFREFGLQGRKDQRAHDDGQRD